MDGIISSTSTPTIRIPMLHAKNFQLLSIWVLLWACPAAYPQFAGTYQSEVFNNLKALESRLSGATEMEKARQLSAHYDSMFSPGMLRSRLKVASREEIEGLFQATKLVAFYSSDDRYAALMVSILHKLESDGLAEGRHLDDVHGALIQVRMFSEAHDLAQTHPLQTYEQAPTYRESPSISGHVQTKLEVGPDSQTLTRNGVDLQGVRVLVIAHPLCRYTADAFEYLHKDPILKKVLLPNGVWLTPQARKLTLPAISKWNRQHPEARMALVYKQSEWQMLDTWATPTFYFLKNGKVLGKVVGWPAKGRRSELLEGLRSIGLQ